MLPGGRNQREGGTERSNPSGKHPEKHRFDLRGARSGQPPPRCRGAPRGAAPVPRGWQGGTREAVGAGRWAARAAEPLATATCSQTGTSSSTFARSGSRRATSPGLGRGISAVEALLRTRRMCQRRGHQTRNVVPLPAHSPPRAEQVPEPAEAPPAGPRADSLPAGAACRIDPGQGSRARALPVQRARAGGRQRTTGLTPPRQAEAGKISHRAEQLVRHRLPPGADPALPSLPEPGGNAAPARLGRVARVSWGQTGSTPRSGGEDGSAAVCHRSPQRFDLERGEGEGGIRSRLRGVRPGTALPSRAASRLIPSLARNLTPLRQARAAAPKPKPRCKLTTGAPAVTAEQPVCAVAARTITGWGA